MKHLITITLLALLPVSVSAQGIIYEPDDSARIENILYRSKVMTTSSSGERIIAIASEFIDEKYIAGTLEQGIEEPLFVSCTKLDCTTFVELVLAIAKTADEENTKFSDVCRNLEKIRYRSGKNNGYTSRLHYISWWITDSAKDGIIAEVTSQASDEKQRLNLNFMSTHPSSYPLLKEHPDMVKEIEAQEIPYRDIEVNHIPKGKILSAGSNNIKTGDIIAITTSIPGLDVSHIGFAYYDKGRLCLLHASSGKGKVIKETLPLCDYLANNKRHTGIRVFRVSF